MSAGYAELHCLSNFTFLRGASHPEELIAQAHALGYRGLALTDECSVAGIVRAHVAARERGFALVVGSEFSTADGPRVVVLAASIAGYAALCELISHARQVEVKGRYRVQRDDLRRYLAATDNLVLWLAGPQPEYSQGAWLKEHFTARLWLAVELFAGGHDRAQLEDCRRIAGGLGIPVVASGNVHMHDRERQAIQDVLTAIRLKRPVQKLGFDLYPNRERHLRTLHELEQRYPAALLQESLAILERIEFSLDLLRYEYPRELVPEGETPTAYLRRLTERGMHRRWPNGAPARVLRLLEHEFALVAELAYEPYFLTVYDIVQFAQRRGILCQGRGSAANSVICYCLGITEVDPARIDMLFERFISRERAEPPDIDIDFEHERREEVIQYVYAKYGRERAALAAAVITYGPRSAIRDVARALGMSELQAGQLAHVWQWWDDLEASAGRIAEAGFDMANSVIRHLLRLVRTIVGFPRHLSQHVGGFVITDSRLSRLVPIENAAMPDRTVIQWDKNDLEALGLLKVDVLGLGMLSAIRRSFELIEAFDGRSLRIADIPPEDPQVYDMICRADTIGVFQIESRAQMAMLPRLRPRCYYDLVIEVAIVRPGPIQGDMVHPYLRRRNGEELVSYPGPEVEKVLQRTLGVPIFQEQVMQLAIVAAGFTAGEADGLRRAMAAWRRSGQLERFEQRLIDGMLERGYAQEFAAGIVRQIRGFGEYGFPESHAASFALLVYVSAWLKRHEPAAFFCALLNSQPMGFYAPAQLLRAARSQGVETRAVDVNRSCWDCTLERDEHGHAAIRIGLRFVSKLSEAGARRLIECRKSHPFEGVQALAERARLHAGDLAALAAGGALQSLAGHRHRAHWQVAGIQTPTALLKEIRLAEGLPLLRAPTAGEDVAHDYRCLGFSLASHPLKLLRRQLDALDLRTIYSATEVADGRRVRTAGLVITRQRPGSAAGVIFVTLEDETGYLNLVVWKRLAERQRSALLGAHLLAVSGRIQKAGGVVHLVAEHMEDCSSLLNGLRSRSRDFQ